MKMIWLLIAVSREGTHNNIDKDEDRILISCRSAHIYRGIIEGSKNGCKTVNWNCRTLNVIASNLEIYSVANRNKRYAATSTILICAFLISANLERAAH